MSDYGFLDHVDRRTTDCLRNIENLGGTVDILMNMSHRDSYELRSTADRLRRIIEKLESRAAEIDNREKHNG